MGVGAAIDGSNVFAVKTTLLSATCLNRGYFEPAFVRQIVKEHLSNTRDHALRLWQLVVFERWHRQYVDAPAGTPFLASPHPTQELSISARTMR